MTDHVPSNAAAENADDLVVDVADEQTALTVDAREICRAVREVLTSEGQGSARISVAVVDDPTIRALNRSFLAHDYATDVLSFLLSEADDPLEGEVVVSADTAIARAPEFGWPAASELILYVIHGTLHLCGYDDQSPEQRQRMRDRETDCLKRLGSIPSDAGNSRGERER